MSSLLEITGLVVERGPGPVLRGVDLAVEPDEVLGVLGPNGAGKTTLLETIMGLHRPAAGRISFDGHDITGARPQTVARRGIALVPEGRRLFDRMSVADNLRVGAEAAGRTRWRWVLELFPQLEARLEHRGGALSGGEQQMVAIGRALVSEPRLMILDEPSWGLAPLLVETVLAAIGQISDRGTTVVLVEQNVDAALKVAGRVSVLSGGEIVTELDRERAAAHPELIHQAYFGTEATK